jgi:hypothetical protein
MRYVTERITRESTEEIHDGIVDENPGKRYTHIEHQIVEEATGDFEFRGGGTNVAVDTSVHIRYRDNNGTNNAR